MIIPLMPVAHYEEETGIVQRGEHLAKAFPVAR